MTTMNLSEANVNAQNKPQVDLNSNDQEPDATAEPSSGFVFLSEKTQNREDIDKWPSLGHYIVNKLATEQAERTILIDAPSGRKWLGKELKEKILNVAAALVDKHDFQSGEAICISYDQSDITCILALGIVCAGGLVACIYPKDPYAELLYLAKKVEPRLLFCHETNAPWAERLQVDLKIPVEAIVMGGSGGVGGKYPHFDDYLNYNHREAQCSDRVPLVSRNLERQIAFICMSSGTTGKPKAVPVSHLNCLAEIKNNVGHASAEDVYACSASIDYATSRIFILKAIEIGYSVVLMDRFEPSVYADAIERYRITTSYLGAAAFFNLISYERLDDYDISSLRAVAPLGAKMIYLNEMAKFFKKHPHITGVLQIYGASELSGVASRLVTPDVYLEDCDNCGTLQPGIKAKIVDQATGKLLGPNESGMLYVGGLTTFPGYYDLALGRQREKMANGQLDCFVRGPDIFDENNFYKTGDLAYFNDRHELYMVGRYKELMSCRGARKVLPQELEEVIEQHPAINKVCVIGAPNKREPTLQCPRAFVTVKKQNYDVNAGLQLSGATGTGDDEQFEHEGDRHLLCTLSKERRRLLAEDLMAFVDERVGWEKQLTGGIVILDDIPTSIPSGKIDKNNLRALQLGQVEIYGDRSGD